MRGFGKNFITSVSLAAFVASAMNSQLANASAHTMFEEAAEREMIGDLNADGGWKDGVNNPTQWSDTYKYELSKLPTSGRKADFKPWSDIYWPSQLGGIAMRWRYGLKPGFHHYLHSKREVLAMSQSQLAMLSPAEKYDIFMGRFDYPTVRHVRGFNNPRAQAWEGICHGWASAALNHPEPASVTVAGPSGITVPFGSGDVKALLDWYYARFGRANVFLGLKCDAGSGGNIIRRLRSSVNSASCKDVNPGAMHVIFANELGIKKQGFSVDIDRMREIWNQPVYAFESRQSPSTVRIYRGAAPGTARIVQIRTKMFYTDELDQPSWTPVVGTSFNKESVATYDYYLELDRAGRIIGGEWISDKHPDFLWNAPKIPFLGEFEGINQIYRPVTDTPPVLTPVVTTATPTVTSTVTSTSPVHP